MLSTYKISNFNNSDIVSFQSMISSWQVFFSSISSCFSLQHRTFVKFYLARFDSFLFDTEIFVIDFAPCVHMCIWWLSSILSDFFFFIYFFAILPLSLHFVIFNIKYCNDLWIMYGYGMWLVWIDSFFKDIEIDRCTT